jgi:hypothetical protein
MGKQSVSRLPFPMVSLHPEQCVSCTYDLSGVKERCPECGVRTDGEPGAVLIAGVPSVEDANPWRRLAFVVLVIAVFVFTQGLTILGNMIGFMAMAWIFVVIVVSIIAVIVTSPTKKRSVERVAFTRAGFGRAAWGGQYDGRFILWTGRESVKTKQIGSVWQKLTVFTVNDQNKTKRIFETGFRCRREEIDWIGAAIEAMSKCQAVPAPPEGFVSQPDAKDDSGNSFGNEIPTIGP